MNEPFLEYISTVDLRSSKKAENALLDSGATDNFIHPKMSDSSSKPPNKEAPATMELTIKLDLPENIAMDGSCSS